MPCLHVTISKQSITPTFNIQLINQWIYMVFYKVIFVAFNLCDLYCFKTYFYIRDKLKLEWNRRMNHSSDEYDWTYSL